MHTIVVSAVNIRKGGTLTMLRDCLSYLSTLSATKGFRIVALVHRKSLFDYPNIEYIEFPWSAKSWFHRLWCEYVTMMDVSKKIGDIDLWLSLHDTTPRVAAKRQAVYCHNSFPFLDWHIRDIFFNWRIVGFAVFTKAYYRFNIHANSHVVVQQQWLRDEFIKMFRINGDDIIVFPPTLPDPIPVASTGKSVNAYTFIYPSFGDIHKNFELVCRAAEILENKVGKHRFKVALTINPQDCGYTKWLHKKWGHIDSIEFIGFMPRKKLFDKYAEVDCLIFASKVESWGLPISEFASTGKPMLLIDRPYAHETAAGSKSTAFFKSANQLADMMHRLIDGDESLLTPIQSNPALGKSAYSWDDVFTICLE